MIVDKNRLLISLKTHLFPGFFQLLTEKWEDNVKDWRQHLTGNSCKEKERNYEKYVYLVSICM